MNKADFITKVKDKGSFPTLVSAEVAANATIEAIKEAVLAEETVTISNFGTFKIVERGERKGRNPRTGEEIIIPAYKIVRFTPAKTLKDKINAGA